MSEDLTPTIDQVIDPLQPPDVEAAPAGDDFAPSTPLADVALPAEDIARNDLLGDDLGAIHQMRGEQLAQNAALGRMRDKYPDLFGVAATGAAGGAPPAKGTTTAPAGTPGGGEGSGGAAEGAGLDLPPGFTAPGRGAAVQQAQPEPEIHDGGSIFLRELYGATVELPLQTLGALSDDVKNTYQFVARDLGSLPGVIIDPRPWSETFGARWATAEEIAASPTIADALLPEIARSDSVIASGYRSLVQFGAGFVGAGKIKALQALGPIANAMARGAIADFSVFDPHEERLSNLIQSFPALENPVNEYLAASPDDGAVEGRLKSAVEGLGFGVAAEGAFRVLRSGLNGIRAYRAMKANAEIAADPVAREIATAENQRAALADMLESTPDEPLVAVRDAPGVAAARALEEAQTAVANVQRMTRDELRSSGLLPRDRQKAELLEAAQARVRDLTPEDVLGVKTPGEFDLTRAADAMAPIKFKLYRGGVPGSGRVSDATRPDDAMLGTGGTYWSDSRRTAEIFAEAREGGSVQESTVALNKPFSVDLVDQPGTLGNEAMAAVLSSPEYERFFSLVEARLGLDPGKGKSAYLRGAERDAEGGFGAIRKMIAAREGKKGIWAGSEAARKLVEDAGFDGIISRVSGLSELPDHVQVMSFNLAPTDTPPEVFINWSRIDSVDDVKAVMQTMADSHAGGIREAQRGVRSWEATKLDAAHEDAWAGLVERGHERGHTLNAEQSVALRELWARSAAKLRPLAQAVVDDPGSDIARIAFRRHLTTHNFIQEGALAARTEVARALNSWKIPAGDSIDFAGGFDTLRELSRMDKDGADIAARIVALSDAGMVKEADAFTYGTFGAKGAGMIRQLWYASLLSGPHTHMRNMLSNAATIGQQITERKVANLIGRALGQENVVTGETAAMAFGQMQGLRDAFRISSKGRQILGAAAKKRLSGDRVGSRTILRENQEEFGNVWRAAATGESGMGIGKVELPQLGAFSPERLKLGETLQTRLGVADDNPMARVFAYLDSASSVVDSVSRAPGHALMVEDEIFKAMNFRAEMNAQAYRMAAKEVESGKIPRAAMADRITALVNDPTDAMRVGARDFAQTGTFTNTPLDTKPWQAMTAWQRVPVLGRVTLPFRRTLYNIATFGFQRTPLAPFVKQWRDDLLEGGAKADLAWSKFLVGNAILASMVDLSMSGYITGEGSTNPKKRAADRRMNRAPYSIRLHTGGDPDDQSNYRNFSYRGFEPLALSIGWAANIKEILEERDWNDNDSEMDELILVTTMAIAEQVTAAQFMSGVSDFFNTMSDPTRFAENWARRLAGSVVPTGVNTITKAMDPTARAVGDWMDQIRSRTPGLSKDLPANRDMWGREINRESGLGAAYDILSPSYSSSEKVEPIDQELGRLELWLDKPGKTVSFDGVKVNLKNHLAEWSRYVELAGNAATKDEYGAPIGMMGGGLLDELNALVKGEHPESPVYDLLTDGPDGGKAQMVRKIQNEFRTAARGLLLQEFPWLDAEVKSRDAERPRRFLFEQGLPQQ
ncbi:MAG TPA: hypothetical protein VM487_07460 [Phycisphaerae bacterium]|nr:hypothetical protein [Phycisphaerae bacterium]